MVFIFYIMLSLLLFKLGITFVHVEIMEYYET